MKTFIQFESIFPLQPIEMNNKTYEVNELNLLHNYTIPVHKNFDKSQEKITTGFLFWNEHTNRLYFQMWINAQEVSYFEHEIISGRLVPMNIRFTPDNINDDEIKNMSNDYFTNLINRYIK